MVCPPDHLPPAAVRRRTSSKKFCKKDHVVLRFRPLGRHDRSDAFAVRRDIVVRPGGAAVGDPFYGPYGRLVRNERIPLTLYVAIMM